MDGPFESTEEEEVEFVDDQFRPGVGTATKSKLTRRERIAIEIKNEFSELPQASSELARVIGNRVLKIDQIAHVNARIMAITIYLITKKQIRLLADISKIFIEDDLWKKATQRLKPEKKQEKLFFVKLRVSIYKYGKAYLEIS